MCLQVSTSTTVEPGDSIERYSLAEGAFGRIDHDQCIIFITVVINIIVIDVGLDILVSTAIRCGLDGLWNELRWERDVSHPSRPALEPTQPPINRCHVIPRVILWSSGQSFWLQIQRSRVRFPALPDFSE